MGTNTSIIKRVDKNDKQLFNVLDNGHYKLLAKYLACLGINPYQNNHVSNIIVILILSGCISIIGPTFIQLFDAIRDRNMDEIIEGLPMIITEVASIIKVLNIRSNRNRFKKLFESVARGWKQLEAKSELCMLEKYTDQGGRLAAIYRRALLVVLLIFLTLPLISPIMDIIVPLNETRSRQHIFKVNYLFLDAFEHFYPVYMHMSVFTFYLVFIITTVDSLYIIIIHHACGLFAVCGYQVQQATEINLLKRNEGTIDNGGCEEFKECVMMHYEAILFYNTLETCCRNLYLIQMGLNMLIISLTAVEVVIYLNRPDLLLRTVVFLAAQKFHLYVISLPGQVLLDQSIELGDKIYNSQWYQMPVNIQRVLYIMQIRCNRPCILTAGGLYEMKIESFGIIVKTCISYMTMFLSLRE